MRSARSLPTPQGEELALLPVPWEGQPWQEKPLRGDLGTEGEIKAPGTKLCFHEPGCERGTRAGDSR